MLKSSNSSSLPLGWASPHGAFRFYALTGSMMALVGLGLLARVLRWPLAEYLYCPFRTLTGWPCPGCGLTRGSVCLLHGQAQQAADHHLLAFVMLPLFAVVLATWLADALTRRHRLYQAYQAAQAWLLRQPWYLKLALVALVLLPWLRNLLQHHLTHT